jgi:hypothetical protein
VQEKKSLAFLKPMYYIDGALGLSFYFRIAKNWPTRYSAGLSSAYDPVKLGPKALFLPAIFILFSIFLQVGYARRPEEKREQKGVLYAVLDSL